MPESEMPEQEKTSVLPLKHINYSAEVVGTFAKVTCVQQFENKAEKPVEAVYVFPMPEDASIIACLMKIGERRIEAEIKKREEARKEYDEAVEAGHHASLLEQERPNIFTMNVGGIEPGEEISVTIRYVQRVPWQAGGGRFSIPLVVAPRFIPGVPTSEEKEGSFSPDTDEVPDASRITPVVAKEGVSYDAEIVLYVKPGFDAKTSSPSHPDAAIAINKLSGKDCVYFKTPNIKTDRDFIYVYTSLSDEPKISLHAGKFNGEEFLLASVIPPGNAPPVSSDIVFVLDCSGSMSGEKIDGLKIIAKKAIRKLKEENAGHRVGIVPFDSEPWPPYPISDITDKTESFIDELEDRGGTRLGLALEAAEAMFSDPRQPRVIVMVTDGDTESGKNWKGKGIRLVALGIDTAVNDERINGLARDNNGVAEFVYPGEDYDAVANRLAGYVSGPVLQNVKVIAQGDVVGVSDVFLGRPATISVRGKGKVSGVTIEGIDAEGKKVSWELDSCPIAECGFARQIWARDFIRENPDAEKQIEASLKYKVICKHTSFVAVCEKEIPGQKPERVEIPVNLPAGWDYEAVFGAIATRGIAARGIGAVCDETLLDSDLLEVGDAEVEEPMAFADVDAADEFSAKDLVTRMIAILKEAELSNIDTAQVEFADLKSKLKVSVVETLSDEDRAMAYYFALRLVLYGCRFEESVIVALSKPPKLQDTWYELALKEAGRKARFIEPEILSDKDSGAQAYVAWKFGKGPRPTDSFWSQVP